MDSDVLQRSENPEDINAEFSKALKSFNIRSIVDLVVWILIAIGFVLLIYFITDNQKISNRQNISHMRKDSLVSDSLRFTILQNSSLRILLEECRGKIIPGNYDVVTNFWKDSIIKEINKRDKLITKYTPNISFGNTKSWNTVFNTLTGETIHKDYWPLREGESSSKYSKNIEFKELREVIMSNLAIYNDSVKIKLVDNIAKDSSIRIVKKNTPLTYLNDLHRITVMLNDIKAGEAFFKLSVSY